MLVIGAANILVSLNGLVAVTWQNLPYRILYAYPFFVMWLGVGITQIKSRLALVVITLLGIVFCIANVNYFRGEQFLRPSLTVPWRSIFAKIASEKKPPTVVLCYGDFACHYYANLNGYCMYTPGNWAGLSKQNFNDVWYIRSNLGRSLPPDNREAAAFTEISNAYPEKDEFGFAPQDLGIRWLKGQWLRMDDYEYRVNVYHFNR